MRCPPAVERPLGKASAGEKLDPWLGAALLLLKPASMVTTCARRGKSTAMPTIGRTVEALRLGGVCLGREGVDRGCSFAGAASGTDLRGASMLFWFVCGSFFGNSEAEGPNLSAKEPACCSSLALSGCDFGDLFPPGVAGGLAGKLCVIFPVLTFRARACCSESRADARESGMSFAVSVLRALTGTAMGMYGGDPLCWSMEGPGDPVGLSGIALPAAVLEDRHTSGTCEREAIKGASGRTGLR